MSELPDDPEEPAADDASEVSARIEGAGRTQAKVLDLSRLGITTLPDSISKLTQLQGLNLSDNQFATLPESISKLTQLQRLYLSGNQLATLPESLRKLKLLEELYLRGNDALGLPAEVLGPGWGEVGEVGKPAAILEYYFRTRGGERRPLNEAKLILVGRGAVGKTSLVKQLVTKSRFDPKEKMTEGIRITGWDLKLNGSEDVRLNVWDFGGQEIMHATHQFFLTQRSLYLLVLSGREGVEDADADYWLKLIESFGGESPVIVVLNKIKEFPFDVNRRGLQGKYPFVRKFIETDCADETGIEELRKIIERETDGLADLRAAFPAAWFDIKDKLAGMKQNYLNFDEYRACCTEHGETDTAAQETLAGFLHRLGVVLNYRDDPRMQDMHVLNPHWVTEGIYKIINSKKLDAQRGEIRLGDLAEILDTQVYPSHMHRFIIDLMKKFRLCFSYPDDDTHYLIPELLDKQEPPATGEFAPEACLNFEYHYAVLPEGLLPQFIVRTNVLSEGRLYWRTGVVLDFEGCRALVKADVPDKKVFINILGPAQNRRRLLAVVRSDFERIHRDIRMQPLEIVPLPDHPDASIAYQKLLVMEQNGVRTLPEAVGNELVNIDVYALLNGVDLEGTRRKEPARDARQSSFRVFISYAHKDDTLKNKLAVNLKILQSQGLIETWDDRDINAGDDWKQKIDENLERADIILLLVSPDFMASDYCSEIEGKRALERDANGEARVIPVILRRTGWKHAPFAYLEPLPQKSSPVTEWKNRDKAWLNVEEGIRRVVEEMRKRGG